MATHILKLIEEGEHQQLDFKFCITDSKKIARSLVAFSNTDGGRLLIGVKDNGRIAGVRSEEEFYMVEAAASLYSKPPIKFESKAWEISSKTVLEVIVNKSDTIPHKALMEDNSWLAFVRVGDQNLLANKVMLEFWKKQKRKTGIKISYSDAEKSLFKYFSFNVEISLTKFTKIARIPRQTAESILSDLLVLKIISIKLDEKGAVYELINSSVLDGLDI